jgi:hypothetical protein
MHDTQQLTRQALVAPYPVWFRVQFGKKLHAWVFQSPKHGSAGRVFQITRENILLLVNNIGEKI